jgi:hypothetical protein
MSVRQNVFGVLNDATVTALLAGGAAGIHAGASLEGSEFPRPFLVYRVGIELPVLRGDDFEEASDTNVQIWVYDAPGSYKKIEQILDAVRARFRVVDALRSRWLGDSEELADDEQKAILKYGTFACAERVSA